MMMIFYFIFYFHYKIIMIIYVIFIIVSLYIMNYIMDLSLFLLLYIIILESTYNIIPNHYYVMIYNLLMKKICAILSIDTFSIIFS